MTDDQELPNLELLIKLMKMTTSDNSAEALVAIRKANEQLTKFGGDWERLLRGKVTVIGDPFASIPVPPPPRAWSPPPSPPPPPPPRYTPVSKPYRPKPFKPKPTPADKAAAAKAAKHLTLDDLGL